MNPFRVLKSIQSDYRHSVEGTQVIKDPEIRELIADAIETDELLWREPYVQILRRYKPGAPLKALADDGTLHPGVLKVFYSNEKDRTSPPIRLHMHQLRSIQAYAAGKNYLVATGTSSGKSNCFFIPIVDACLKAKEKGQKGIKAIVVYPMNALANSQYWNMAQRLVGTGLKIGRYTGQTANTEAEAMKAYRTEPLETEVIDRENMYNNPPDILITNYKMLEYMLIRPKDRRMLNPEFAESLQFLVLDEAHTYEGRRGADVALLMRRVKRRMKGKGRVRCVATSATLVRDPVGTKASKLVEDFFSQLFGEKLGDYIVEEEEELPEPDIAIPSGVVPDFALIERFDEAPDSCRWELAEKVLGITFTPELRSAEPLRNLIDRSELYHRVYQALMERPKTLAEIVEAFKDTGHDEQALRFLVEGLLRLGMTELPDGRQIIPTRLHAFFQSGGRIAECLKCGFKTVRGLTTCPNCSDGSGPLLLLPLHFCRTCGEKLYGVRLGADGTLAPYEMDEAETGEGRGFLMRLKSGEDFAAVRALCDDSWFKQHDTPRRGREGYVPVSLAIDPSFRKLVLDGCENPVSFSPAPLMMCPSCGVRTLGRQRNALAFVSRQSRADAVNALTLGILAAKPDPHKAKTLVFVDSVQDAAYHAGHMDDWYTHLAFRQLLYEVVKSNSAPLRADEAAVKLLKSLEATGILAAIAPGINLSVGRVRDAILTYLEFCVLDQLGLTRGDDAALEQAGLISVDYEGLDDAVDSFAKEQGLDESDAHDVLRAVLDEFRHNRAFDHCTWIDRSRFFKKTKPMTLDGESEPRWFFKEPPIESPYAHYLGGQEQAVQRVGTGPNSRLRKWIEKVCKRGDLLDGAIEFLKKQTLLVERTIECNARSATGLVLDASVVLFEEGSKGALRCPSCRRVYRWKKGRPCVNKRCGGSLAPIEDTRISREYITGERELPVLEVEDHSSLVNDEKRVERERAFSGDEASDRLNVLVCTPTLELGVDIGALSTVLLRGVPPNPSNYVQRAGRAGRRGKGAVIVTFCSTQGQNPHDQHYYRHPEQMIAGRILVPKFDLASEGLQHSHVNAIVSEVADTDVIAENKRNFEESENLPNEPEISAERMEGIVESVERNEKALEEAVREVLLEDRSVPKLDESLVLSWIEDYPGLFRRNLELLVQEYLTIKQERDELFNSGDKNVGNLIDALTVRLNEILGRDNGSFRSPYRMDQWLAATGFLPGYAFGKDFIIVRFPSPEDDAVADPMRALREFGPKAICYAQKRQWEVAFAQKGQEDAKRFKTCCSCGRVFDVTGAARSVCDCGVALGTEVHARRMPSVKLKPGPRVTRAETVRQSRNFAITEFANFSTPSRKLYFDLGEDGRLAFCFYPNCEVTSINFRSKMASGERGTGQVSGSDLVRPGFRLEKDRWELRGADRETRGDGDFFALYATARHDLLVVNLEADHDLSASVGVTLQNAFSLAISEALRQSPAEIRSFINPSVKTTESELVFYETTSGSASALERVLEEDTIREIAKAALELLHFGPSGDELPEGKECAKACYDCLLGYYNQRDHELLDRRCIESLVRKLMTAKPVIVDLSEFDKMIAGLSGPGAEAEKKFLQGLRDRGFPLPDRHHFPLKAGDGTVVLEVDFRVQGVNVLVDGSIHHERWLARIDEVKRQALKDEGILFEVFKESEADTFFAKLRNLL